MSRLEGRQTLALDIAGAGQRERDLSRPVTLVVFDIRTQQLWKVTGSLTQGVRRTDADHVVPSHALNEAECTQIIKIAKNHVLPRRRRRASSPALGDEVIYIAREPSFHRALRAHGQMNRQGHVQPLRTSHPTDHAHRRPDLATSGAGT